MAWQVKAWRGSTVTSNTISRETKNMHCQNDVRSTFSQWLEAVEAGQAGISDNEATVTGEIISIPALLTKLHRCTDILPRGLYEYLELRGTQTYAAASRQVMRRRQA